MIGQDRTGQAWQSAHLPQGMVYQSIYLPYRDHCHHHYYLREGNTYYAKQCNTEVQLELTTILLSVMYVPHAHAFFTFTELHLLSIFLFFVVIK